MISNPMPLHLPLSILGYSDSPSSKLIHPHTIGWNNELGILAIADASSSSQSGNVSSSMAVNLWINGFQFWIKEMEELHINDSTKIEDSLIQSWLKAQIMFIHDSILNAQTANAAYSQMNTYFSSIWVHQNQAWLVHVGEAKIASYHRTQHTITDIFPTFPLSQIGIGSGEKIVSPHILKIPFDDDHLLFIATKSLYNTLSVSAMSRGFKEHPPQLAARLLMSQARALGQTEAISLALIFR
jgi:serine/threonine protein phosphatase PrpC